MPSRPRTTRHHQEYQRNSRHHKRFRRARIASGRHACLVTAHLALHRPLRVCRPHRLTCSLRIDAMNRQTSSARWKTGLRGLPCPHFAATFRTGASGRSPLFCITPAASRRMLSLRSAPRKPPREGNDTSGIWSSSVWIAWRRNSATLRCLMFSRALPVARAIVQQHVLLP